MRNMAAKLALKTGLTKQECDAIIKALTFEMIEDLKESETIFLPGFGTFFFKHSMAGGLVTVALTEEAKKTLVEGMRREKEIEIIFD